MWNLVQEKTEDVLAAVTADMVYFPVPKSSYDTKGYGVSFGDSWMESRSFGGERITILKNSKTIQPVFRSVT